MKRASEDSFEETSSKRIKLESEEEESVNRHKSLYIDNYVKFEKIWSLFPKNPTKS